MDKLDMFQVRFVRVSEIGWLGLKIISVDEGTHFTSADFQDEYQTRGVQFTLAAPEYQKIYRQVEVTWIMLHTILHSLMVHVTFLEAYIHFI